MPREPGGDARKDENFASRNSGPGRIRFVKAEEDTVFPLLIPLEYPSVVSPNGKSYTLLPVPDPLKGYN